MKITRKWAMPNADTFDVQPIGEFVKSYLRQSKISIDPFARNKAWTTYTNDLNPETSAQYHMDAKDFLAKIKGDGVFVDVGIFDPPYSPRQIQEVYAGIGKAVTQEDTQMVSIRRDARNLLADIIEVGGYALSFGWNTAGMGKERGFEIVEILLVCHGGAHNDTLCMAERKVAHQIVMNMEAG